MGTSVRKPTLDPYFWHRSALAGKSPPIHDGEPQPGWYVKRVQDKGPLLPASIYIAQEIDPETGELLGDEEMRAELAGVPCDPDEQWLWFATRPISQEEYLSLMAELFCADVYRGPQRPRVRWLTERG